MIAGGPALAVIELSSVAKGIFVTDAIVKKASVNILKSHPITPGKFLIVLSGEVANIDESMKAGIEAGGANIIQSILLPNAHHFILPAIEGKIQTAEFDSVAIIETSSVASAIEAADIAVKTAEVRIIEMRLAKSLGGKAYFILDGNLADLELSVEYSKNYLTSKNTFIASEIIAAPHLEMLEKTLYW